MRKLALISLSLIIIASLLGGCFGMSKKEEQQLVDQALTAGVQYVKEHYNAEFVMNSYEIEDSAIRSRVFLHGHVTGHEEDKITISYGPQQGEVINIFGPEWFIDSRLPEDTNTN